MTSPADQPVVNPYAAPAHVDDALPLPATGDALMLLQPFRSQMHGLGFLWVFVGIILSATSFLFLSSELFFLGDTFFLFDGTGFGLLVLGAGGLWLIAGLMTICKQLWAVYLGLVGSYFAFLMFIIVGITSWSIGTLVPLMFFGIAIVQAHRVISWAKDLQRLGIPLTARAR